MDIPINKISLIKIFFIIWVSIALIASLRFNITKDYVSFNHNPIHYFYGFFLFIIASRFLKNYSAGLLIAYGACLVILIRGLFLWVNKGLYLSSDIGMFSAIVFPLCLLIVSHHKQILVRLIFGLFACFFPGIILLTQNRTAGVTFFTVIMYLFFFSTHKLKIIAASIPIMVVAIKYAFPTDYWNRFRVIWDRDAEHLTANLDIGTILERFKLWDTGFEMFKENIFLGVGPGNYQDFSNQFSDQKLSSSHLVAHNSVISVASETGIAGLILYISLCLVVVYSLLRVIIKSGDSLKAIYCKYLLASILGCFCAGMFSSRQDFAFMYLLFGWAVALTAKKSVIWKDKKIQIISD